MKLGPGLFQKERRIAELEGENNSLKDELAKLQQSVQMMKQGHQEAQKTLNHNNNYLALREVEFTNMQAKYSKLFEDHQRLEANHEQMTASNNMNEEKIQNMNTEFDSMNEQLAYYQNLELKLKEELAIMEKRNIAYEKNIDDLNAIIRDKDSGLGILEKNLVQKNKHIAVVIKEKERLLKHLDTDKSTTTKGSKRAASIKIPSTICDKENLPVDHVSKRKVTTEIDKSKEGALHLEVSKLSAALQEKDVELERLQKENFNLLNRVRNSKK